jgi:DNA modification methylase
LGAAAKELNRNFILIDQNRTAIDITKERLGNSTGNRSIEYFVDG